MIVLSVTNMPLRDVLREIEKQTSYSFVINNSRLTSLDRIVTVNIQDEKIENVLDKILEGTNISYSIRKKQITLIPPGEDASGIPEGASVSTDSNSLYASSLSSSGYVLAMVSGRVTDEKNAPLPGVNILEKGTTNGVVSDSDGNYTINVSSGDATLVFSFIGYLTEEIQVNNRSSVDLQMQIDSQTLKEVVVVGYGTQEKKDVTGSISSLKGVEFQNLPVASASQALQGRLSGVNIIRSGGAPGNTGSIRIRGIGTVNDSDPLIVIDGVPATNINDVNPNDIESVEVLKDASASAIYGTRAANGVVIVTTKRGKFSQPLHFTVNGYSGVSNSIKTLEMLDAPTMAQLKRERYTNDGLPVNAVWEDPQYQSQKTDWQKEVLRQGSTNNFDISLNGGGERSSFALSGAYYNEKGMIRKSYYKRYSFRINSDHKVTERFKIGQNLQLVNQNEAGPSTLSAQDGLLWSAIRFHPGLPVKNPDGTYSSTQISSEFGDINNPVFTLDTQDRNQARTRILGSVNGDVEIISGLHVRANYAMDVTYVDRRNFEVIVLDQTRTTSRNALTVEGFKSYQFLQEYTAYYEKKTGDHKFTLLGGFSAQTFNDTYVRAQRKDFPSEDPSQRFLSQGAAITDSDGSRSYDALVSGFGRLNYDFNGKYLATITYRADASSRFPEGKRWGNFPAFSLGWRISDEPFFTDLTNVISNLKLTGGWGQLGNQNVPRLQYLARISTGYRYSFGDQPTMGSAQSSLPNPNISWETAEMTNLGIEAGFLENRLLASINYFNKQTKNMLLSPPSLGSNGTAAVPDQNAGQLENKGIELELGYRGATDLFTYSINTNATFLSNKVIRLYDGNFLETRRYGRSNEEVSRIIEGQPFGVFYGWKTDGIYQNQAEIESDPHIINDERRANGLIQPGDVRFIDLNNDGIIDDKDRTVIGSPIPKITYGLNASAGFKGFDLTVFFLGVSKVDIFNADRMQGLDPTYSFNMYAETINRWHGEGTSNSIPRMTTERNNLNHRSSDLWVESGAFFRLKNITLGYTLPGNITGPLRLTKARFYVTGQNVFLLTKYRGIDPELGYTDGTRQLNVDYAQYPQARTWSIGASLTF